jgi:hypothetical protein
MPFSAYKTVSSVLKEFQITYTESNFIVETEFHVSDYFREDLEFTMREEWLTILNLPFAKI